MEKWAILKVLEGCVVEKMELASMAISTPEVDGCQGALVMKVFLDKGMVYTLDFYSYKFALPLVIP